MLTTDDVHAAVKELTIRGVHFDTGITPDFWGTWTSFDDPDGNGWVLSQPPATPPA